jgi:hypothetical protein
LGKRRVKAKAVVFVVCVAILLVLVLPIIHLPTTKNPGGTLLVRYSPTGDEDSCGVYNANQSKWYRICYIGQTLGITIDEVTNEAVIEYDTSIGKIGNYSLEILVPFTITGLDYLGGSRAAWSATPLPSNYGSFVRVAFNVTSLPTTYGTVFGLFVAHYHIDPVAVDSSPGYYNINLPFGNPRPPGSILKGVLGNSFNEWNWNWGVRTTNTLSIVIPKEASVSQSTPSNPDIRNVNDGMQLSWNFNSFYTPLSLAYSIPSIIAQNGYYSYVLAFLSGIPLTGMFASWRDFYDVTSTVYRRSRGPGRYTAHQWV